MQKPEMEPQPRLAQVGNLVVEALKQKYFPTYQHELTGSKFLPAAALQALKHALPDEDFLHFMTNYCERGEMITRPCRKYVGGELVKSENVPDPFSVEFGQGLRRCRIRELCKNKKPMVVLYQLLTMEKVTWEDNQAFVTYVHVLEGRDTSTQASNIVAQALIQKYWPTYEQDFIASQRIPAVILKKLLWGEVLPDTDIGPLITKYCEEGTVVTKGEDEVADDFSISLCWVDQPGSLVRSCRVRKLCENKRVMVVLYELIATEKVKWEHGPGFLNYVHVLEGIGK